MIRDSGKLALFVLIIGYLIGNGVQIARGRAPSPVLVPKADQLAPEQLGALAAAIAPHLLAATSPAASTDPEPVRS